MSTSSKSRPVRPGPRARRSPLARLTPWPALLAATVGLSGCSLTMLAHRAGLPFGGDQARAMDARDDIGAAKERCALLPAEPYWPFRLAELYVAADSLPAAERALRQALRRDAAYAPALSLLSKLYFDSGRHAEAIRLLEPVQAHPEAFPADVRRDLLAGLALHEDALGQTGPAISALAAGATGDPGHAGSAMVYVALRGESPDSATALAGAVLRQEPHSAVNLNNYGITRLRAGDADAARNAFMDAIRRDPALPGPYYNLAILERYYANDDSAATAWFRNYWKRSHADPDSLQAVLAKDAPGPVVQRGD